MKKFILLLSFLFIAESVTAAGLVDLYSGTSQGSTKSSGSSKNYSTSTSTNYSSNSSQKSDIYNQVIQQSNKNQGYYSQVNKLTNPVRIGNPYNNLNNKYLKTTTQTSSTAKTYDGSAVKFKQGSDGKIYGYNDYGIKVGTYKVNNNGTITQTSKNGKTTVYK